MLRREEREQGKGRRWRKNFKALQNQMILLEEDEQQLELVYPQVGGSRGEAGVGPTMEGSGGVLSSHLQAELLGVCFWPACLNSSVLLLQSEDPDYKWAITVMGFYVKFLLGIIGLGISICWVVQVILYILIDPPASPFLNTAFVK